MSRVKTTSTWNRMEQRPDPADITIEDAVAGTSASALADAGYAELEERRPTGYFWRLLETQIHILGLAGGGLVDWVRTRSRKERRGLRFRLLQILSWCVFPFIKRSLVREPFPVQLRRRFEILGPSFIKLGQILSLREDVLPRAITDELQNLLSRLPALPFQRYLELVVEELGRPLGEMFTWVDPIPTGSASIAQLHRATTIDGDSVILKLVKPGICKALQRDARLLQTLGAFLQLPLARYQPRRMIQEFTEYTLREVDLQREAENCDNFAALFEDMEDVRFPRIFPQYSSSRVLCMEFFNGFRPDAEAADSLSDPARDKVIDLGAESIIRMLYRDGYFHADLHPGNLLILPGPKIGFIDLGMVGRLEDETRRTLLYYFYCLVTGDPRSAARYLTQVADPSPESDVRGFQRAVEEVSRRWQRASSFSDFSLAQLILESVTLGGRYRMFFPVEMILMTKALVTFEGVGNLLKPGFDVAATSRPHIRNIFFNQFNPWNLTRESLRGAPEMIDALVKAPMLINEGLRLMERNTRRPSRNPLNSLRGPIFGGSCLVTGAILVLAQTPWPIWGTFLAFGMLFNPMGGFGPLVGGFSMVGAAVLAWLDMPIQYWAPMLGLGFLLLVLRSR